MDLLTLVARLTLDSSDYEAGLAKMQTDAVTKSNKIKGSMLKLSGAGVAAMVAFGGASVKTGMEFDKSMSQVAATMGKTMDELLADTAEVDTAYGHFSGNLRDYAKFMGANTVFSAQQASEALNYMALAGYTTKKSMQMLPEVMNLAAAGGMDLARASDMVTDSESALHLKGDEVNIMIDQMAQTASKTNTSVEQLGDAILTVGGTANYMSGGTKELNQVLGILADNGIKGSEAGTHLRNMLLKLASPSKEGAKWIERLGVQVFDSEGKMRSFQEVFPELNEAMSDLTEEEKMQALSDIFNARDVASANALLGTTAERWGQVGKYIEEAQGSAQKMADTQLDNLAGDITLMKSAFEGLQIKISDGLSPVIRQLVQFITGAIETFDQWIPIVAGAATAFGIFAVAINIGPILTSVATAFNALWLVISANPIGLAIALIAGLVVALKGLWDNNEGFRNFIKEWFAEFEPLFNDLGNKVSAIGEYISSVVSEFLGFISELWNTYGASIMSFVNDMLAQLSQIWHDTFEQIVLFIGDVLGRLFIVIQDIVNAIKAFWSEWGDTILIVAKTVWDNIKTVVQTAIDIIKNVIGLALNIIRGNWKGAWENIKNIFSSIWNGIKSLVGNTLNGIKATFSNIFGKIVETVSSKFESIRSKIKEKIDAAKEAVSNAINKIKSFFNFSWSLPKLKMPHISISGSFSLVPPSAPKFGISWYKKAYDNIVEFANPTVIPTLSGLKGFGDGAGSELVMSKNAFFDAIESARGDTQFIFNIYPQKGQSEEEIARAVEKKFIQWNNQKKGAFV